MLKSRTLPFPTIGEPPRKEEGVYLLHFCNGRVSHAQHYVGWSTEVAHRVREHELGRTTGLIRAALAKGITLELAAVWYGQDRNFESMLKKTYRNHRRLCPICKTAYLKEYAGLLTERRIRIIQKLSESSGAGLADCKAALYWSNWKPNLAAEFLRMKDTPQFKTFVADSFAAGLSRSGRRQYG